MVQVVLDKDLGWNKIKNRIKVLASGPFVKVGILSDAPSYETDGGVNVAQVATWQEFGAPNVPIPERPFMRETFESNKTKINNLKKSLVDKMATNKIEVSEALEILGVAYKGLIQEKIKAGPWTANAPSTIRAKRRKGKDKKAGKTRPLIDSGRMIASIDFEKVM